MQVNLFADHEFTPLKNLYDSVFKKLHSKSIAASLKTTAVLSADNIKKLWDTNSKVVLVLQHFLRAVISVTVM